jgi:hypothetical protein
MATVEIKLQVDSTGAIRSVEQVGGQTERLEQGFTRAESAGSRLGRTLEVAFGVAIQRLAEQLIRRVGRLAGQFRKLAEEIADIDNAFNAMFRSAQSEADKTIKRIAGFAGFTTTEARKLTTEIGGIALAMQGNTNEALQLADSTSMLAAQWERVAGLPIEEGIEAVSQAMAGQFRSLRRRGIVLTEARIAEQALIMTGKQHVDQLRDVERAQATVQLITEAVTRQYGELEGATLGITQRQRALVRTFAEVRDNMVRGLTPAYGELLQTIIDVIDQNEELMILTGTLMETFEGLSTSISLVTRLLGENEESISALGVVLGYINEQLNTMNRQMGMAWIVGSRFFGAVREAHPALAALADVLGLSADRLQQWNEEGAKMVATASGIGDILRATRLLTQEATQANVAQIEKLIEEWEAIENLDQARSALLVRLREELAIRRELLAVSDTTPEQIQQSVEALTAFNAEWINIPDEADMPDFQVMIDALLEARDTLIRFGEDGRVSVEELDESLKRLNEEIRITADPQRRQQLIEYRDALNEVRNAALGTHQGLNDMTVFMQTTMANALSQTIIAFTDVFEGIGRGAESMAQGVLRAITKIIQGIGHQLIAWGTAQLLMGPFGAPGAASAISYGAFLAAGGGLAAGALSGGGGRGVGGGSRTISRPAQSDAALSSSMRSLAQRLNEGIKIEGTADIDGENIHLSFQRVTERKQRTGEL